ncbi:MAG: hypothetical protein U5R14_02680 [Gemmatimonadota bacterium]|nr:hypothetical protein [Gemmatimonadota bacterium]
MARVELERSRQCVEVIARIEALETELEPLANRSQRLMDLSNAIALEDRASVEPFDTTDPVEADVAEWFDRDQALAERILEEDDEALVEERAARRQAIKQTVSEAVTSLRREAEEKIAAAGDLTTSVGGCDGAILLRDAVVEECENTSSPVCEPARDPSLDSPYRFVNAPSDLWEVEELRPWTSPTSLGVREDGQVGGARTVGYARSGNVTLTAAFSPLLGSRDDFTPEQLDRFQSIVDSAGFEFDHPDMAFAPALTIQATVPEPLAGETLYVLHFDGPEDADVLWTGPAGTGDAVEATMPLSPTHLGRLGSGHPLRFTAVVEDGDGGEGEVAYSIQLTSLNQSSATRSLMGYMSGQLSEDLDALMNRERGSR